MKTLFILRHAKSSWSDAELADFDRPLNDRGERDAPLMGQVMFERHLRPELALSSPAMRARRTAQLVMQAARLDFSPKFDNRIYEASPQTLRKVISEIDDDKNVVMIVGHNPGVEGFIRYLTGDLVPMSTGSLAAVELDIERWRDIDTGRGRLLDVLRPKEIAKTNQENDLTKR